MSAPEIVALGRGHAAFRLLSDREIVWPAGCYQPQTRSVRVDRRAEAGTEEATCP